VLDGTICALTAHRPSHRPRSARTPLPVPLSWFSLLHRSEDTRGRGLGVWAAGSRPAIGLETWALPGSWTTRYARDRFKDPGGPLHL